MSSVSFCKLAQDVPPMLDNAALYTPAVTQPAVAAPMLDSAMSNDQVTEDILTVVDKLSDKFNETFQNVTDPEVYRRINDTLQQMDPGDLARIGAMLGGGLVGFKRAMSGDSPASVLQGVTVGAALGAAGGYALPKILDSLVGAKTASLVKGGAGFRDRALGFLIKLLTGGSKKLVEVDLPKRLPRAVTEEVRGLSRSFMGATKGLDLSGSAGRGILGREFRKTVGPSLDKAYKTVPVSRRLWGGGGAALAATGLGGYYAGKSMASGADASGVSGAANAAAREGSTEGSFGLTPTDIKFMLGGLGVGSLLGLLYGNSRKRDDSEEEPGVLMPTLVGGGLGTLGGLLAGKAFTGSGSQGANSQ